MVEAGVLVGLDRDTAATLVRQTFVGAAALLVDGSEGPEALRAAVTSPGCGAASRARKISATAIRSAAHRLAANWSSNAAVREA